MDKETLLIFEIGGVMIVCWFYWFCRPYPREKFFGGHHAKQFFVNSFSSGWVGMRGPFALYTTDDGIWMGRWNKYFYRYSEIQSVVTDTGNLFMGQGYFTRHSQSKLTLRNGKLFYFEFIRKEQKEKFFEILEEKKVTIVDNPKM